MLGRRGLLGRAAEARGWAGPREREGEERAGRGEKRATGRNEEGEEEKRFFFFPNKFFQIHFQMIFFLILIQILVKVSHYKNKCAAA